MTDEESFLNALRASPVDDTTRLVFADWLDENGQSQKASYLRLVAALGRAGGDLTDRPEGAALVALSPELPDDWRFAAGARFVVTLFGYGYSQKINMIKHLRELTGSGLDEAKAMSEHLPYRVRDGLMFDRARVIAHQLRTVPEAVAAVLPTELESLPYTVGHEVVAVYSIRGQPHDRARAERDARAALATFLARVLDLSPAEAADRAATGLAVLDRYSSGEAARDRAQSLMRHNPPSNLSGGWSVGVFARNVATEAE